ncbi:hypothetical protein DFH06DRAFT_1336339 [Mycena polygramma]|nr:hypothetical protein DFH06DRAFT_1336339 [Mycena polygramma]
MLRDADEIGLQGRYLVVLKLNVRPASSAATLTQSAASDVGDTTNIDVELTQLQLTFKGVGLTFTGVALTLKIVVRRQNILAPMLISVRPLGVVILCIMNSVLALPQRGGLTRRASSACATQCQPMQSSIAASATGGIVVLCTSDVANHYKACLGCEVATSIISQLAGQAVADSLVTSCKTAGHSIDNIAVTSINPTDAPTNAPVPATSSVSTTRDSVTSNVAAVTPTLAPLGSVSVPEPSVSQLQSPSVPATVSAVASIPVSSSVASILTSQAGPTLATVTSQISTTSTPATSKPPSAGVPSISEAAPPAASTVVDAPSTNGATHHSGGLSPLNAILGVCIFSVYM